jgi:hypothetical protein
MPLSRTQSARLNRQNLVALELALLSGVAAVANCPLLCQSRNSARCCRRPSVQCRRRTFRCAGEPPGQEGVGRRPLGRQTTRSTMPGGRLYHCGGWPSCNRCISAFQIGAAPESPVVDHRFVVRVAHPHTHCILRGKAHRPVVFEAVGCASLGGNFAIGQRQHGVGAKGRARATSSLMISAIKKATSAPTIRSSFWLLVLLQHIAAAVTHLQAQPPG